MGFRLLQLRRSLSPLEVDQALMLLRNPSLLETIKAYGDMDRPRSLVFQLAKQPDFYPLLRLLIRKGLYQIFR
jgi:hypothetical protein